MASVLSRKWGVDGVCLLSFLFERSVDVCRIWEVAMLGALGMPIREINVASTPVLKF